jgi:uncharacterized membrane protein YdjX (TVP38/TMEM64 family)
MQEDNPTQPSTLKRLGPVAWLGLLASTLPPLGSIVLLTKIEPISQWLRQSDTIGPLVYIAGFTLFAGLALLPTYATAVLGGWAFGWVVGLPCAMLGFMGASMLAYFIARRASGDRVKRVLADNAKWNAIARALFGSGKGKTLLIVSLVRLPPNSPFALTNLVLASVGVPLPLYLLGTFLGMLPRTAAVVYAASHLQQLSFEDGADWRWFALGIAVTIGVLWVLWYISRRALERVTTAEQPDGTEP